MACPGCQASLGRGRVAQIKLLCPWFYENLIRVHQGGGLEAGLKLSDLDTEEKRAHLGTQGNDPPRALACGGYVGCARLTLRLAVHLVSGQRPWVGEGWGEEAGINARPPAVLCSHRSSPEPYLCSSQVATDGQGKCWPGCSVTTWGGLYFCAPF